MSGHSLVAYRRPHDAHLPRPTRRCRRSIRSATRPGPRQPGLRHTCRDPHRARRHACRATATRPRRVFEHPADTYTVFGDMFAGMRSLRHVLDQLATTHLAHRARAFDDNGNHTAGAQDALAAADELHQAGTLLDQAYDRLDAAF